MILDPERSGPRLAWPAARSRHYRVLPPGFDGSIDQQKRAEGQNHRAQHQARNQGKAGPRSNRAGGLFRIGKGRGAAFVRGRWRPLAGGGCRRRGLVRSCRGWRGGKGLPDRRLGSHDATCSGAGISPGCRRFAGCRRNRGGWPRTGARRRWRRWRRRTGSACRSHKAGRFRQLQRSSQGTHRSRYRRTRTGSRSLHRAARACGLGRFCRWGGGRRGTSPCRTDARAW